MTAPNKFAHLLTQAVHKIRLVESKHTRKNIGLIQDELGYALGREGGSSIEYWRKGNIPATVEDVEKLARELVRRGGLQPQELQQLLQSAAYPHPQKLIQALFPAEQTNSLNFTTPPLTEHLAPFVVGPPISHPRQFFGRERELKRIFNLWRHFPLQNVALVGLHRSGKTSLLRYVQTITTTSPAVLRPNQRSNWLPQAAQYRWVFVDFQDARMGTQDRLLRYLLTQLHLPGPQPCTLNSFLDIVSEHLQQPTVILMDEIGAGLAAPELDQQFWWSLRALGSNYTAGKLGFILTAHELPALLAEQYGKPSPFFNIFGHIITMGPLTETAARDLIANSPRPFPPADVEWILQQSHGWPALLQILCDTRLQAMEENLPPPTWQREGQQRLKRFDYLLNQSAV